MATMTSDAPERAIAASLERDHPAWVVWWGAWSRLYWGISAVTGDILFADTWEALDRAMRDATALHLAVIGAVR